MLMESKNFMNKYGFLVKYQVLYEILHKSLLSFSSMQLINLETTYKQGNENCTSYCIMYISRNSPIINIDY